MLNQVTIKSMTHRLRHFLFVTATVLPCMLVEAGVFPPGEKPAARRFARNLFYHVDRVSVAFGGGYNYAGIGGSFIIYPEEQTGRFRKWWSQLYGRYELRLRAQIP